MSDKYSAAVTARANGANILSVLGRSVSSRSPARGYDSGSWKDSGQISRLPYYYSMSWSTSMENRDFCWSCKEIHWCTYGALGTIVGSD